MIDKRNFKNNKLIIEFMNFIKSDNYENDNQLYIIPRYFPYKNLIIYGEPVSEADPDGMLFNSSWDWLIPTVEKIESIKSKFYGRFGVFIAGNNCTIQGIELFNSPNKDIYFNQTYENTKFKSTYSACINFIKYYNKNIK